MDLEKLGEHQIQVETHNYEEREALVKSLPILSVGSMVERVKLVRDTIDPGVRHNFYSTVLQSRLLRRAFANACELSLDGYPQASVVVSHLKHVLSQR